MAMDKSFSLESALQRFFARCPKLLSVHRFAKFANVGFMVTEDEVVGMLAEVFLLPNYTIPLMGCFRPIARKIVDKAVWFLRSVPNLRSNYENAVATFDNDRILEDSVTKFYNGRGMDLHELACLAFCRALDLDPSLLGSVLIYFEFAPPPFQRILVVPISELKVGLCLLLAVRASYRLLLMNSDSFSRLWDWSCFLDLVSNLELCSCAESVEVVCDLCSCTESVEVVCHLCSCTESAEVVTDVKWCAVKILSLVLKLSDRAIEKLGIGKEDSFSCYLRWEKFCQDVSLEKAGWYISGSSRLNKLGSSSGNSDFYQKSCLQSSGLDSQLIYSSQVYSDEPPLRTQRLRLAWDHTSSGNPFVLTSAMLRSFETVSLAVSQKWPVLLYGPSGSGKTSLISKLAQLNSERDVVSIPMDDQIDGKTLLGSYVSSERPGEFRWQPGSLSQAVENGYWVVFEDIDKAPSDVHSILLPLLEGTNLFITGHGEEIRVAESFRLFATISTSKLEISSIIKGGNSISVFWRKVMVGQPNVEDLKKIVKESYPSLEPIAEKLIESFDRVKSAPFDHHAGLQYGGSDSVGYLSRFSLRDLLKWCKRIAGLGFCFDRNLESAYQRHCIYQEAVDIFAASSASVENRLAIRNELAKRWQVPLSSVGETFYPADKPVIQDLLTDIRIGRVSLQCTQTTLRAKRKSFVEIRSSLYLLERLAASVKYNEPVLMVGETGTGKTTLVQDLALRLGQKLTVLNLSQQSDVADLLGGFKPMDAQFICFPLYKEFLDLSSEIKSLMNLSLNPAFFTHLQKNLTIKKWKSVVRGLRKGVDILKARVGKGTKRGGKRQMTSEELRLENFSAKLGLADEQINASSGIIFSFVEGAFVNALKNGEWILLDEVNLAPPETLQRVIGVLDGDNGSLCLAERGDITCVRRHPNFRLFACMNPATDAGKRDLPFSLRSRFTEYFVDEVSDDKDLTLFVDKFLGDGKSDPGLVSRIVSFYKAAKRDAEEKLQDGANQKPQYSLRSLYRALEYTRKAERTFGFQKAMYDGFCMFFQTLLDRPSAELMDQMIISRLLEERDKKTQRHVPFDDYLTSKVKNADSFTENYILTRSVRENLRNVARAILIKRYPVLLQGPTSSGKTSLVRYLAAITGHEFVRINNHEHTDLQEYLGTYITDASGKLVFHEGVLVRAVRNGSWIVLDELNLAPSDVLEALNRLLDDNRELFVPELQETVRAHPDFMLFATQNPPTVYGGRKMLSRAFRNRFVEIHVDEIPEVELSTIIEGRCKIPESYAKKMVDVMKELQLNRQRSKVFAGKHGYITPRDLFRWADRFRELNGCSYDDLARDGFYLLAERLREQGEKSVIREVLEKHLRVKLVENDLYYKEQVGHHGQGFSNGAGVMEGLQSVIWTESMQRLYFLVERCYKAKEPVLLIGETGGGKTTVCQLLSIRLGLKLHILNCHQYTETSDFLGGFYPIRERSKLMSKYKKIVEELVIPDAFNCINPIATISSDIGQASSTLSQLQEMIKSYKQGTISCPGDTYQHMMVTLEVMTMELSELHQKWQTIFMWQDGPLVHAMKDGDLFLVDEISLADDSVLERLNSVLEPEGTLSLAEKGGSDLEKIVAHDKFLILATMNPGGDFGKKELSPALRNRFTEIWVPPVCDINELRSIAFRRVSPNFSCVVDSMLSFWEWFSHLQTGRMLTVRDLLSWVDFVNVTGIRLGAEYACLHGVFLVVLDGLSLGSGISKSDAGELRNRCLSFLLEQMKVDNATFSRLSRMQNYGWGELNTTGDVTLSGNMFGADLFYIQEGSERCKDEEFKFSAPTTCRNALRVMRAMQLSKPVLLEGSPGVGKTSLIVALGKFYGHKVVRINFSEQTDLMDLLGSDLPVESDDGMTFAWSDGILLQALKEGCWVLLDELNLAPQSVLEGLNAILDHRAEVFIPELGCAFKCPPSFRIFACQNPSYQGGGRKGLPKSFLNRFTKVYVDELVEEDYASICSSRFPKISRPLLEKLILFNKRLYEDTMLHHKFAQEGSPWEFNLRDVFRSCEIIEGAPDKSKEYCFLNTVYVQRMRTEADRRQVLHLYEEIFKVKPYVNPSPRVQLNPQYLIVGNTSIKRNCVQSSKVASDSLKILPGIRQSLEAVVQCLKHQWLCILVGPASSGKTSLIRLLAELTGNVLNELHLSSGTDISEILGCFEQYNAIRNCRFVVALVECYINEYSSSSLEYSKETSPLITKWLDFSSSINQEFLSCFTSGTEEDRRSIVDSLNQLVDIIDQLLMEKNVPSLSWSSRELDKAKRTVSKLIEGLQKRSFSAKFEWVSGQLVKAIERGEWIVLENANCCNPTVLDRINSLVEPLGSITINECGIVDGKPVILHPHPNFRMFLTVNPSYGEVSRAMRNRGIEICLMQPCWLLDESIGFNCDEFGLKDVNTFLAMSGIPIDILVQVMAKSHVYARKEGLRSNILITYLELARWVQLFQQLIMDGNQPIWSLQTSWEYVYLSSFGEANGQYIVRHAKDTYLSMAGFSDSCLLLESPLCLPGGWPMPLKSRDFVLYSRECTVKQNCMYLAFLVAQYASCKVREKGCAIYHNSTASSYIEPSLMDVKMLHQIMFPCDPILANSNSSSFDAELAKKKLLFAANWALEQATEGDLRLYLLWFRRFSSGCQLLSEFSSSVERVMQHPIWRYVTDCYLRLSPYVIDDVEKFPTPILSVELVDEVIPNNENTKFLCNAINCVGLLKLTYKQWNDECKSYDKKEVQSFMQMLKSLKRYEEDFLKKLVDPSVMLVESSSFDVLIQMYANVLEDHIHFWNNVEKYFSNGEKIKNTEEDLGKLLISWRFLLKSAAKLKEICPETFDELLKDGKKLDKVSSWRLHSEKSLLWVYGGHPILPSSALLFEKQLELLKFCESCWPTESKTLKERSLKPVEDRWIEIVASSNSTLRFLVMEGVSMLYCNEDEVHVVLQLDEMCEFMQKLQKWFKQAKYNLKKILRHNKLDVSEANSSTFCSFSTELLCQKSGFDSWRYTLPFIDTTSFYLDMELLQELSSAYLADSRELRPDWTSVSKRLKAALNYSLVFSSRPPQMFLPHQKILSMLDMWTSVHAVNAKVASFVLEMWFRWHQFLWIYCPISVEECSKADSHDILVPDSFQTEDISVPDSSLKKIISVPDMLFQPVMMNTVFQILQSTTVINDYLLGSLKLKVASCSLWRCLPPGSELPTFLLSAVHDLFEQIIIAHQKAFDAVDFEEIKSNLCALRTNKVENESLKHEKLQRLRSHILSSSHSGLKMSMEKFIAPLLMELFCDCSSTDCISNVGRAWMLLGILRWYLLLSCDDLDPAMKYHCKDSQLADKISSLKLEIQVRRESNFLAGWLSTRECDKKQVQALENLEVQKRKLQRKIVFRSNYRKFKRLKQECVEFQKHAFSKSLESLWSDIEAMSLEQIHNWQSTATAFIDKLSDDYPEYVDFVQPVQVAVYEMKLGFSLVVSSLMQKGVLSKLNEKRGSSSVDPFNMDVVMESIYTFMRFPLASPYKVSRNLNNKLPASSPYEVEISPDFCGADFDILKELVTFSSDAITTNESISPPQLEASLYQNILFRTEHFVSNTQMMDSASFMILDSSFEKLADFWRCMKNFQAKTREQDSQQYKFRTRAFEIGSIMELDISTIGRSLENGSSPEFKEFFSEWKELVSEDQHAEREDAYKEQDNSEGPIPLDESVLNNVVHIHDQLFGLNSFIINPGAFQISDEDRLLSFIGSYTIGTRIIRGLKGSFLSNLDARLAPEHMLRLCLEHEQKFVPSHKSACRYNFYKDSNALEMSKMVKLLYPLEQRVNTLLEEWEDHHGLRKILNVIKMLLNIPVTTPLAKVLSGLQFLVNSVQILQENGSKFSLSDQLEAILVLVVSWHKLEFESWPILLDEVQHQYDLNAGKLWFPLYPILLNQSSPGMNNSILSLEDFIQTSSIGEFRRRLQLLFAFLGQIHIGLCLKFYSSSLVKENMKILYNVYGFYVQFLPRTLEHIEDSRKGIEKELKELLKLCSWERPESFLSIGNSKRTRQKFRKLIQKYNDFLQQPVMLFLNKEAELKKERVPSEHVQNFVSNCTKPNVGMMNAASDLTLPDDDDRFTWYADWRKKVDGALKSFKLDVPSEGERADGASKISKHDIPTEVAGIITQCSASQSTTLSYGDAWNAVACKIKRISRIAVDCDDLWKEANKSQQKRRALSELLKLLESSGLSRHKPVYIKDQVKSWWFLEPLHEFQHLLPAQNGLTYGASNAAAAALSNSESLPDSKLFAEWPAATESYFRSVASVLLLQQICLNCHKDITCEQVDRSLSFLHQLIEIQQKQHAAAVVFAKHLKCFKECVSILNNLYSNCTTSDGGTHSMFGIVQNQDAIFRCMWQQKKIFDSLCSISHDELLLLRTFENTHLDACETVKADSHGTVASIEKFFPSFKKSKELLDNNLLGQDRDITKLPPSTDLFVSSKHMEKLVSDNFDILMDFENHLVHMYKEDVDTSSVKKIFLGHFEEALKKGRLVKEEFISATKGGNVLLGTPDEYTCHRIYSELEAEFLQAIKSTFEHIEEAMGNFSLADESPGSITSWRFLFESLVTNLSFEHLCNKLLRVISCARKLLNGFGDKYYNVYVQLEHLHLFLDIMLNFGIGLLQEHLDMHKTVSAVTCVLADVLASLYSRGFGICNEDEVTNASSDSCQDASGTGMGDGAGKNDVSDQITDEDQLLGASNKPSEEQDTSGEAPNKNDKGIEMEQDFEADTFDVSEDSEEDMDEVGEEEQLDSAMGETGADSEVVNEKLWNKDEDENPDDATEKYESGPSVRDTDTSSRELRAKEDSPLTADEPGELNPQEVDKSDGETGKQDDLCDDEDDIDDVNLDKEEAFTDSTGLKPDDLEQDMDLDKEERIDSVEEADPEVQDESADRGNSEEENPSPNDEAMAEAETGELDMSSERDELGKDLEQNAETNLTGSMREMSGLGISDSLGDAVPNAESPTQLKHDRQESDSSNMAPELNWSSNNETASGLAPSRGLPSSNTSELDRMASESSNTSRDTRDQPQTQLPQHESSSVQKNQSNPYRSHGDPYKEWKERVKVFVDLEANDMEVQDEIHDENADEFGYVPEFEQGTSQALGLATSEQIDSNVNSNKIDESEPTTNKDDLTEMDIEKEKSELHPLKNGASFLKSKIEDQTPPSKLEETPRVESQEIEGHDEDDFSGLSDGLVSVRKAYFSEGVDQLSKLSINDSDFGKAQGPEDTSTDAVNNSTALWRRYELLTTRLSQELAEQLRLVMEPTLASKLQGDYKTGKRINMKKVIPYIASHFRRDKIWLRRTRPNKRDYQVVIAVDDSRSMSESCCGNVALEALVAVCRAMSQLEMGDLAVASFGKKGNIRLLHDFGQPFTGEAGVKMISSFTFKQENTIADEPVVDLLEFLHKKLDAAVVKARLPSGQNPLQQLVLIIADGRLHEKENLKRRVRHFLSRKRMVAFLILDSPQDSIVDLMELVSWERGVPKFSKYMDSFPFPYYIVLRNIDALPRTLADLLRQWFELMQYTKE